MTAYADRTFLAKRVHTNLLSGKSTGDQDDCLAAASREADSYLGLRFTLPLTAWGDDLRDVVCEIAAYKLGDSKGFAADGSKTALRQRYDQAIKWLCDVRDRRILPSDITDSSVTGSRGPVVFSDTPRGW